MLERRVDGAALVTEEQARALAVRVGVHAMLERRVDGAALVTEEQARALRALVADQVPVRHPAGAVLRGVVAEAGERPQDLRLDLAPLLLRRRATLADAAEVHAAREPAVLGDGEALEVLVRLRLDDDNSGVLVGVERRGALRVGGGDVALAHGVAEARARLDDVEAVLAHGALLAAAALHVVENGAARVELDRRGEEAVVALARVGARGVLAGGVGGARVAHALRAVELGPGLVGALVDVHARAVGVLADADGAESVRALGARGAALAPRRLL